tara:strand:- start:193 stop:1539 length:1347 start_codon:yes stop_codon:yes gene_type:complete
MSKITFLPDNKICDAPKNITILEVAKKNKIPHVAACGGEGKCTTCRLLILEGIENCSEETDVEQALINQAHTTSGFRLACQTSINGNITARRLVLDSDDIQHMSFDRQGESKKIAIIFSDIRGFTPFSEKLTPYDVVFILNRYFKRMVGVIEKNHGHVDNYIGDGIVAIFGMNDEKNPAEHAVKAALEMVDEMDDMKPYLKTMYGKDFDIGVGVHWGNAVVGDIGAGQSKKYTAIGDAMNFASRVESANKQFKSRVLISDEVYNEVKDLLVIKDFMRTMVKGIEGRVTLHEVEQIHLTNELKQLEDNQKLSDGYKWNKCSKVDTFESEEQQVFRFNKETILIIKVGDEFFGVDEKCPHMNLSMKGGGINAEDGTINCAWHNTTFCYKTGDVKTWLALSNTEKFMAKMFLKSNKQAVGVLDVEPKKIEIYPTQIIDDFVWVGISQGNQI